jgi:hypothetical protein
MNKNFNTEYGLLFENDLKTDEIQRQVTDLWTSNQIYSSIIAKGRLARLAIVILHEPTNTVVGTVTGTERYSPYLGGTYYYLGVFVLPHHCSRPKILERAFNLFRDREKIDIKGIAVLRKNNKVSDKLLKRYRFKPSSKPNVFFRDFHDTN